MQGKMYSVAATATATATITLLLLGVISTTIVVDGKFPDTTILSGPDCYGKSTSNDYNNHVGHLLDDFVKDTKISRRNMYGDRQKNSSYPNRHPGSPYGSSTCNFGLGRLDCYNCLFSAKNRLNFGCLHPLEANITLQDCNIWFKIIH